MVDAGFLLPILICVIRKFGYLQKYFPLELCPKLGTEKISPRQVDGVGNKSGRRLRLWIIDLGIHLGLHCTTVLQTFRAVD